jgi:hypothetical protein
MRYHLFLETGFRPAIYYIAITTTIQGFEIKKNAGATAEHAQKKRNEDNGESTKR